MILLLTGLSLVLSILAVASCVAIDRRIAVVARRLLKQEERTRSENVSRYLLVGRSCGACKHVVNDALTLDSKTRDQFFILAAEEYSGADLVSPDLFSTMYPGYLPSLVVLEGTTRVAHPVTNANDIKHLVNSTTGGPP